MFEDFNAKIVYTGKTAIFSHVIYATAAAAKSLQSCPTLRPHRQQPTRLLRPWDFPGKSTGVVFYDPIAISLLFSRNLSDT